MNCEPSRLDLRSGVVTLMELLSDDDARRRARSASLLPKHAAARTKAAMPKQQQRRAMAAPPDRSLPSPMKASVVKDLRVLAAGATDHPSKGARVAKLPRPAPVALKPRRKRKLPPASNQWTSVACDWSNAKDSSASGDESDDDGRQINAGVYVLENLKTGHCHVSTTWDLRNAKAQNFADLASGAHPHVALVQCFQLYGASGSGIRYRVLERVKAPLLAPKAPTHASGRHATHTEEAVDVKRMEQLLQRRLHHHVHRRVRKCALQLVRRRLVLPVLQCFWPRWVQCVRQQQRVEQDAAATELQRIVRGRLTRSRVQLDRRTRANAWLALLARVVIAKCVVVRRKRRQMKDASARLLQRAVRRFLQRRVQERRRLLVRKWLHARRIQACYRGYCGRHLAAQRVRSNAQRRASTAIQRTVRGFLTRRSLQRQRIFARAHSAAAAIQTQWRGVLARRVCVLRRAAHAQRQHAALAIQHCYRRCVARKLQGVVSQIAQQTQHATTIRVAFRHYVARKFGWAATTIAMESAMATILQRSIKRWLFRQSILRHVAHRRTAKAAQTIQSIARGRHARREVHALRTLRRHTHGAQRIQRAWRARRFLRQLALAVARDRRERSALHIQAHYRRHRAQALFAVVRTRARRERAAVQLQCLYRSRNARREWRRRLAIRAQGPCEDCSDAAAALYSIAFRMELCSVCWRERYTPSAATNGPSPDVHETLDIHTYRRLLPRLVRVQCTYRAYQRRLIEAFGACSFCDRRAIREQCDACGGTRFCHSCAALLHTRLKRTDPAHAPRTIEAFNARERAARAIQSHVRRFQRRQALWRLHRQAQDAAATRIQRVYASRRQRRATRALCAAHQARRVAEQSAAQRIQSVFRGHVARRQRRQLALERASAIHIQRLVRGRRGRHIAYDLRERRDAAVTIQRLVRGVHGRQIARTRRQELLHRTQRRAAVCIQRRARGRLARRLMRELQRKTAAQTLQRAWRYFWARTELHKRQAARIAALERANAAAQVARECAAATCIQTCVRQWLARAELYRRRLAHVRTMREQLCAQACALEQTSAIVIQRFVRTHWLTTAAKRRLAVHCRARQFLSRCALTQLRRERHAAVTLQRAFRHARVRWTLAALATDTASAQEQQLWVELFDDASGCVYFFNTETLESQWERPPELGDPAADDDAEQPEWLEYWDESAGASYYYNTKTGEATWTTPDGVAAEVYYTPEDTGADAGSIRVGTGRRVGDNSVFRTLPPNAKTAMALRRRSQADNQVADALMRTAPAVASGAFGARVGSAAVVAVASGDDEEEDEERGNQTLRESSVCDWSVDTAYDLNYKIFVTQIERDAQTQQGDSDQQQETEKESEQKDTT